MTIYVDTFHTVRASLDLGRPVGLGYVAIMIGTELGELHRFAHKIGASLAWFWEPSHCYLLPPELQRKAVLLGAVEITPIELAAMISLRHLGVDMEPSWSARKRLAELPRDPTALSINDDPSYIR